MDRTMRSIAAAWLVVASVAAVGCSGSSSDGEPPPPPGPPAEVPHVTIASAERVEGDGGATAELRFAVTIDRDPASDAPAEVFWSTSDGTAGAGSDYVPASGTLTFVHGGPATQEVAVEILGDAAVETDETFSVALSLPTGATVGDAATGTIRNDDWPRVDVAAAAADEGDAGTTDLAFVVTISEEPLPGQDATVAWSTADGTAAAPADYASAQGTVTFSAGGGLTRTVHVAVAGDRLREADEQLEVRLSSPARATLGAASASGVIRNDDFPSASVSGASVLEGTGSGTTTLTFTVTLDVPPLPGQDAQVDWTTVDGTATAGVDYVPSSGTLTFSADGGATATATVSIEVVRDADVEPDETVAILLSAPARLVLALDAADGTLLADDFPAISIGDVAIAEGDAGASRLVFPVTLSEAPPAGYPLSVTWATSDVEAVAGLDYVAASGTLTFAPGDPTTQSLEVEVTGDTMPEPDETLRVALAEPVNGSLGRAEATGTLRNDDPPRASISDARVVEGNSGRNDLVFSVTLDGPPLAGRDARVGWRTVDGTATAGSDYVVSSGTLSFTSGGPRTQRLAVPILGDRVREEIELFTVELSPVADVTILDGTGVGTIVDDELPNVRIDDVTAAEGGAGATTPFAFTISLDAPPAAGLDVEVPWSTASATAWAGADFVAASGTVVFTSADPTSATVTVGVLGNARVDRQRELRVVLGRVRNATVLDGTGVGVILDDDGAVIRVDPSAAGTPDGLSWATAYPTLQAGVDRAQALGGGQVWVAAGTYGNGGGTGPVLTMKSLVSILGGFDGWRGGAGAQETLATERDPALNVTTLDGGGTAYHVVIGAVGVLDGFTVTRGRANAAGTGAADPDRRGAGMDVPSGAAVTVANCTFTGNVADGNGGAMYVASASPTIRNSTFTSNGALSGGAIYATSSALSLLDDVFQGNTATQNASYAGGYGGAIDESWGTGTYTACRFEGNQAAYGGGVHEGFGGVTVRGCTFVANVAQGRLGASGAGFYDDSWSASKVFDSVFVRNRAGDGGGGIWLRDSDSWVVNTRIENNEARYGAGIWNWSYFGGVQRLVALRVAHNRASTYGGGIYNQQANPTLVDSVVEGNDGGSKGGGVYNLGGSPTIVNCALLHDTAASGPAMLSETLSGSPTVASSPTLSNTIVLNRTFATPAVVTLAGSSTTWNASLTSDAGADPGFDHVPLRASRAGAGSTASTLQVPSASTAFAVGDVVEVGDDGVARTVTATTATSVTIAPALAAAPPAGTHLDDWGPGETDLEVDLRLRPDSPAVDAGSNALVATDLTDLDGDGDRAEPLPVDLVGNPRFADDPGAPDSGAGTSPVVDVGPVERPAP